MAGEPSRDADGTRFVVGNLIPLSSESDSVGCVGASAPGARPSSFLALSLAAVMAPFTPAEWSLMISSMLNTGAAGVRKLAGGDSDATIAGLGRAMAL